MSGVFDTLSVTTSARKAAAALTLTPLAKSPLPTTDAPFPDDHPNEVVESAIRTMRREVGYIVAALDAIDAANGVPPQVEELDPLELQRSEERVADLAAIARAEPNFNKDFADKQEAAQAATFTAGKWECPTHGSDELRTMRGRKRGVYVACGTCGEYEEKK